MPRVTILATGGTIAGEGASATRTTDYTAGELDIGALIKSVPGLDQVADIRGEQVANIDSSHITNEILLNAVIVAGAPAARGRGVMVVMNDGVHGARDVTKTNTTNVDTFQSPNFGPLGMVLDGRVDFYRTATRRHTTAAAFSLGGIEHLPRVDIVYAHGGDTRDLVDAAVGAGARGIVHAGMGDGMVFPETYLALEEAAAKGVIVVRASRVGSGMVAPGSDDARDGMLTAGTLNPQKARILLMLALIRTSDVDEIRRMFGEY